MSAAPPTEPPRAVGRRIDQWLWFARFFKTRSLAARFVETARIRLTRNEETRFADRASCDVRPGDVLTFAVGARIRVVRVRALGVRRAPAREAVALYDDLEPNEPRP